MSFENELSALLNRYSKENDSDTPDFILSEYLVACLTAFNVASQRRANWYGADKKEVQDERETNKS